MDGRAEPEGPAKEMLIRTLDPPLGVWLHRIIIFVALVAAIGLFHRVPTIFGFGGLAAEMWADVAWVVAPLLAALAARRAASRSEGYIRRGWQHFAFGSFVWMTGTLIWISYALTHTTVPAPNLADVTYLASALYFISGLFQFSRVTTTPSRIQFTNFALALCAVTAVGLGYYLPVMVEAALDPVSALIAFAYPALWLSVAVFFVVSVGLYGSRPIRFATVLIGLFVGAQAITTPVYGLDLMLGTYTPERFYVAFWTAAFGFLTWAALATDGRDPAPDGLARRSSAHQRRRLEALVPTLSTGALLVGLGITMGGTVELQHVLLVPALILFVAVLGLREHWILAEETRLQRETERSAQQTAESKERLSLVLSSVTDSVMVLDRQWRITYANPHARQLIEAHSDFALGKTVWEVFPPARPVFEPRYRHVMESGEPAHFEEWLPGHDLCFEVNAVPVAEGIAVFFRNITQRKRAFQELTHMAQHDTLTGLANRKHFAEVLDRTLTQRRQRGALALFSIDLDGFKTINDTMGHPAGDALLQQVAGRLKAIARKQDTVARLGGDEFAIIQPGPVDEGAAVAVARRVVSALEAPFQIAGREVVVRASMGIALAPEHGRQAALLLTRADLALYRAKAKELGSFQVFQEHMEADLQLRRILRLDLLSAIERKEFAVHYQPIIDLNSGRLVGLEALLRWHHPERGLVLPSDFVPLAEECGLIVPIGDWVLETACAAARDWPEEVMLAVNMSAAELGDDQLPEKVKHALDANDLDPQRLELELTESVLLDSNDGHLERLHELRALGVRMALDDFGTGYSSLSSLRSFPFDRLKIDQSFVGDLPGSAGSDAIVRAVLGLGAALGISTTAEGIETPQQIMHLRAHGCANGQGYYFSEAVSQAALAPLLSRDDWLSSLREPGFEAKAPAPAGVEGDMPPAASSATSKLKPHEHQPGNRNARKSAVRSPLRSRRP